jgi:hypothetical protein
MTLIRFGRFGLGEDRRELRCAAKSLDLQLEPFQLLSDLAHRRPHRPGARHRARDLVMRGLETELVALR